jgi:hypothetical protein
MAQITTALMNTLISTQSAPLTLVTDIDNDFPATVTNDQIRAEFTITTYGHTIFLSYAELSEPSVWQNAVAKAIGINSIVDAAEIAVDNVKTHLTAITPPYTYQEYVELVRLLQVPAFNFVKGH